MSYTSTVQVTVTVTSPSVGGVNNVTNFPVATNANAPASGVFPYPLTTGYNTLNVPAGATGVVLVPPVGLLSSLTLKGATGDTGLSISQTVPTFIPLGIGVTQIGITVSSGPVLLGVQWT